jgi:hypothetical protein
VDWGLGSACRKFLAGHHIEKNKKGEGKMKKLFLVLMLVSLVALFAVSAMASVVDGINGGKDCCNVSVDVNVYKRATFCEHTFIDKDLFLNVFACVKASQWAEATIQDCQKVSGQTFNALGTPQTVTSTGTFVGTLTGSGTIDADVDGSVRGVVVDKDAKQQQDPRRGYSSNKYSDPKCNDPKKVEKDPFYGKFKGDVDGTVDMSNVGVSGSWTVNAKTGVYVTLTDAIDTSFNNFTGIAQVNQAAGSGSNQGNALAAAVTDPNDPNGDSGDGGCYSNYLGRDGRRDNQNNDPKGAVAHTEVAIGQVNYNNTVNETAVTQSDAINNSFQYFTGVAQVNQSAGFGNNQKNAAAIAANVKTAGAVAISDAFMSQTNCANTVNLGADTTVTATMAGSFTNGCGLAQVNQSPGSLNNQANTVAISYSGFNH